MHFPPTLEGIDETPEFVAFIGPTDTAAAESFLRKLIAFGEESNGTEYEEGVTRGYLTFVVDPSDDVSAHIALTDDYIVIATGAEALESALDRMDSGQDQDRPSLFDNPGFQEAREAAESPRFGIMYVDIAGIIDQLGGSFDEEIVDSLRDFSDQLPDFIVASSSFIDKGIRVSTSFDYPTQDQLFVPASTNSVGSAGRAPEDTVALLSFVGVKDAWERFRDEVTDLPGLDLDEALDEIEADTDTDIEEDILSWMTGELAFAMLLPGGVSFSLDEIHANVYVEFDDRAKALSSMEKIQAAVEDGGVEFSVVDVEGTDAVVMNLSDDQGPLNLTPGYVVLDDYVVIGTTLTSLRQAVEAGRGDIPSLRESSAFSRPLAAAGNSTDFMIYGNIRRIIKEVLDQLDETELEEYGKTAEPFVEPLEAFLLGVAVEEDIVTFTTVITFSAPTDAPTFEVTPTPMPAPTQAPTFEVTPTPTPAPPVEVTPTPTPAPTIAEYAPDDHGNDFENATRIAIGEAVAVELETLDDRDVLVFRLAPDREYVFTLDWETYQIWDNPGPVMALYDAFGRLLARLNDYDFSEQRLRNKIMWQAVTGGDYYIAIGDENTLGNFALTVTEGEATEPEATPAPTEQPTPPADSFASVSAGELHTCGVKSNGSVACWGSDEYGQVTAFDYSFDSVSAGSVHTCGVRSDGSFACWGSDGDGEATPPAGSFVSVSAGVFHTCGLRSDGSFACWGYNEDGQATPPADSFDSISALGHHTCGVRSDGSFACWGSDGDGEATPPAGSFVSVSAGGKHTCGVRSDGSFACWGSDGDGEATPPAGSFDSVSAGGFHTCGVRSDGSVACWGYNEDGQATPPAGSFDSVSAGVFHTCGLRSDGSVACWGYNEDGQATPPE